MTLEGIDLKERRRLTRAYPVLIAGKQGVGKTSCIETLTDEEKARTVYFDLDNKVLPNDMGDEYRTIIRLKPLGQILPDQVRLYKDRDNIKFKTITELKIYFSAAINHKDVDRIIIDSITALHTDIEKHYVSVSKGFTVWQLYRQEIADWLNIIKSETLFAGKFTYLFAHYFQAKNANLHDEEERFIQIQGNGFPRGTYESNFSTIVEVVDHQLISDNDDVYSSTRIHRSLSPLQTEENDIKDLEDNYLTKIGQAKESK